MKPCLLIIDGSNFLFRAYHALPPLTNVHGQPTGAIRGCITMFKKLLEDFKPSHVAVTFDHKGRSFRNELYPAYKAQRPPMPDDLREQIEPLHNIVTLLGLKLVIIEDVEADDAIATLATRARQAQMNVVIASSDKDLAQLVGSDSVTGDGVTGDGVTGDLSFGNTIIFDGMKNLKIDRNGVFEKYGVYPELIRDYLALMGDKSDNIPGIDGVGPKTAAKWLNEYGSLDNLIENAAKIGGKVGEKFRTGLAILPLSVKLTTLVYDANIPLSLDDLKPIPADINALKNIYEHLGFRQLLTLLEKSTSSASGTSISDTSTSGTSISDNKSISATSTPSFLNFAQTKNLVTWIIPPKPRTQNYQTITALEELIKCVDFLKSAKLIAIDTETNSLDYMSAALVGISLAVASGEAFYIPLKYSQTALSNIKPENKPATQISLLDDFIVEPKLILDELRQETNVILLNLTEVITHLKPILEDEKYPKVGQHLKFDWHILKRHGIDLKGIVHDTMLLSYVLNPSAFKHNLDELAKTYLNQTTTSFESIAGKGVKQLTFDQINLDIASAYACEDADITLQLSRALEPQVNAIAGLKSIYTNIEMPLLPILAKMEHRGILLDTEHLQELHEELNKRINTLELEAYALAGETFNLGSSKQLAHILFEKMQIPVVKKTPGGVPSTGEEVLETLALDYPLPKLLLEHRSLAKLNSTYTISLIAQVNADTGRVHTSYNQALTNTGRLSSSNPNLQNIPIRTKEGRRIRQAFIAKVGYVLMAADYSQIELRLMAHFSKDEALVNAFKNGEDVHKTTASQIFQIPLTDVTREQRSSAKAINFGLIYGMGAFGLAKALNISRTDAKEYIARYFSRFTGVLSFMEQSKIDAKTKGYVETLSGRRLYLPAINSPIAAIRAGAERIAINAPLQGTAADIIKLAMLKVDQALSASTLDAHVLLQVHDELVLEVKEDQMEKTKILLENAMTTAFELDVPLEIEIGTGFDWDEAH